jgi:xanthine dehydrogenase accessory factor
MAFNMEHILTIASDVIRERRAAALCIVVASGASTPRKEGAKMIVFPDGKVVGSVGGGSVEKAVVERAITMIPTGKPARVSFDLGEDLGMHCGGTMEVYIEPLVPQARLFIFGAGHIGKALAQLAREIDFPVTLIDPRDEIAREAWTTSFEFIQEEYLEAARAIPFDDQSFIVIVTPKHLYDEEILAIAARRTHAYLGMIGSRNKIALLRKRFLAEGILSTEELDRIDMPIGLKFRAETPQEIAVSILAKLIDVRNTPVEETFKQ